MSKFLLQLSWTEQGIRDIKNFAKRAQAARDAGKKLGVEVEQVYITTGDNDLLLILESASGDNVAKYAISLASLGNVRTRMSRAWTEAEFGKMLSELP
jgi:uncharacterized protein with GYD domain